MALQNELVVIEYIAFGMFHRILTYEVLVLALKTRFYVTDRKHSIATFDALGFSLFLVAVPD